MFLWIDCTICLNRSDRMRSAKSEDRLDCTNNFLISFLVISGDVCIMYDVMNRDLGDGTSSGWEGMGFGYCTTY